MEPHGPQYLGPKVTSAENPPTCSACEGGGPGPKIKNRFLTDFGTSLDPNMAASSAIFGQKVVFFADPFPGEASWSRPGRDLVPKTLQERISIDVGSFTVAFGRMLIHVGWKFHDF